MGLLDRFKKVLPSIRIGKLETSEDFFERMLLAPIKSQVSTEQNTLTYFNLDLVTQEVTLSAFGADVVEEYVSAQANATAKHYYPGYSGNRMPKVLFNERKTALEWEFLQSLPKMPQFKGAHSEDYEALNKLLFEIRPLIPLMFYKSVDVSIVMTDFVTCIYSIMLDILYKKIRSREDLLVRTQDLYLLATELTFPLSVKGYTILHKAMPSELSLRMVTIKAKTRLAISGKYSSPVARRIDVK